MRALQTWAGLLAIGLVACGGGDAASGGGDAAVTGGDAAVTGGDAGGGDWSPAPQVARATVIPACTVYVDAANDGAADGTAALPYQSIGAAVAAAADGAVICVAEGTYEEALAPGLKYFTLAGGFQSGSGFTVRDSSVYVSKAQGDGANVFFQVLDEGPTEGQLTAIEGFEITGYSQGVVRAVYYGQRFDLTDNYIHDNVCAQPGLVGGGFSFENVSGTIRGNVIARNVCGRGGGGALGDSTDGNAVTIAGNRIDGNAGDEPESSHGGGLYLFCKDLTVTGNDFTGNTVTGWGGGLYVGASVGQGQHTTGRMSWNVYRANRAGNTGGGFFCDDAATCISAHEVYDSNCGGNVYLDAGSDDAAPTTATFDHVTIYGALTVGCDAPGPGVQIDQANAAKDSYSFTNSIFWGNAKGADLSTSCQGQACPATVSVRFSDVQTAAAEGGIAVSFGEGNLPGVDPLFVDAAAHDLHLLPDSPALERAEDGSELGAYGGVSP